MILELDIGNTRIKWRTLDDQGERQKYNELLHADNAALKQLRKLGDVASIIRVASVAGPTMVELLQDWWGNRLLNRRQGRRHERQDQPDRQK